METAAISRSRGRKRRGRRPADGSIGRHIHPSVVVYLRWIIRARARFRCSLRPSTFSQFIAESLPFDGDRREPKCGWYRNDDWIPEPDWIDAHPRPQPAWLQWQRLHPLRRLCGNFGYQNRRMKLQATIARRSSARALLGSIDSYTSGISIYGYVSYLIYARSRYQCEIYPRNEMN